VGCLDGFGQSHCHLLEVFSICHGRPDRNKKAGLKAPLNLSLFDNTLVLGTLYSGCQRSSLDVVDVRRL